MKTNAYIDGELEDLSDALHGVVMRNVSKGDMALVALHEGRIVCSLRAHRDLVCGDPVQVKVWENTSRVSEGE